MVSVELGFTLGYILVCLCFVAPPSEFRAAGITVQNILAGWLGSEDLHFIHYHVKRTAATALIHAALPLGYYAGLSIISPQLQLWDFPLAPKPAVVYFAVFSAIFCGVVVMNYIWSRKGWEGHPIAKRLKSLGGNSWRATASAINVEFRRVDKFSSGIGGTRLYITDSWILKTGPYNVDIAHQANVHLRVVKTEDHVISHETGTSVQYLRIAVEQLSAGGKTFTIRLNSTEYGDLKNKLSAPIHAARDVVIRQSLSDMFLEAFREQVSQNPHYSLPEDAPPAEPCIGCMQTQSNVKLVKHCEDGDDGECVQCYCRPMWCLECMGKWFSSRQDQAHPERWLAGKSPCPTCRAKFCMLDVCFIA